MSTSPVEAPDLADVFRAYPHGVPELLAYHDILLRGESDLSISERELIAAYVSGINACGFCFGAHSIIASAFGLSEVLIRALVDDLEAAPVEQRLKSLLHYVGKLTRTPARVTEQDRAQVYAAGWSARALHDAVATCALFNFMNRLVEGMGVRTSPAIQAAQRERHDAAAQQYDRSPYVNYGRRIGVVAARPDASQAEGT